MIPPGYKQTEVGLIPEDWEAAKVGEISRVIRGASPRPKGDRRFYGGPVPRLMVEDVTRDGKTVFPQVDSLTEEGAKLSRPCKKGTLTIVCSGTVGIPSFLGVDACIHDGFLALVSIRKGTSGDYLYYQFDRLRLRFESSATHGGVFTNLTTAGVREFIVPLPPTEAEQRAIAEALSDVDALLAALDRLIAKQRDLKQAAMQQLLTGQTRLPGFTGKWETKRLGEVVETDPENLGSGASPKYAFNYISLENVDQGNLRGFSEEIFVTAPSRARRILRKNDVLVSTVRPNLKSHLLFQSNEPNWVCSTGFCVLRCRSEVTHPGYVFQHLFAAPINQQIDALLTGSNYPSMNSRDVRALEIPIPDYPEQTAIAEVLTDMDATLSALEQRRGKTRALKQGMMQELLTGRTRLV